MKIPIRLPCTTCREPVEVWTTLTAGNVTYDCPKGHHTSASKGSDITVGQLLLERAHYEFSDLEDWASSIVFSAAALDCQLSDLFLRWTQISALKKKAFIQNDELEEMLRRVRESKKKIETVGKLLDPNGIDDFVKSTPDLHAMLTDGFPSLLGKPLPAGLQEAVFWPRNAILHLGKIATTKEQAVGVFNTVKFALLVLDRMETKARENQSMP